MCFEFQFNLGIHDGCTMKRKRDYGGGFSVLGVSSCVEVRPAERMSLLSLASSSAKCLW